MRNTLTRSALSLVFCVCCFVSRAQTLGLQFSWIEPTGNYGYVFRPAPMIEALYSDSEPDDRFIFTYGIGYFHLVPERDTFLNYAIGSDGNGTKVLPGFEKWDRYNAIAVLGGFDAKLINPKHKLTPTVGLHAGAYFISYRYENYVETLVDEHDDARLGVIVVIPRIGAAWRMSKKFTGTLNIGRSLGYQTDYTTQAFWKTSLALYYNFD